MENIDQKLRVINGGQDKMLDEAIAAVENKNPDKLFEIVKSIQLRGNLSLVGGGSKTKNFCEPSEKKDIFWRAWCEAFAGSDEKFDALMDEMESKNKRNNLKLVVNNHPERDGD